MSPAQTEFQIPEGYKEYPKPTTPNENEAPVSYTYAKEANRQIDRHSIDYTRSAEIALKNQAELRERRAIIGIGNTINRARQAELEKRLNTLKPKKPKLSLVRRAFGILAGVQLDTSTFRIKPVSPDKIRDDMFRQLINRESSIGANLTVQPPLVSRQEIFLSDVPERPNEWHYHAESVIPNIRPRSMRYVVSEADGVFKSVDNNPYALVVNTPADAELDNFVNFTKKYYKNVAGGLYKIPDSSDYDLTA